MIDMNEYAKELAALSYKRFQNGAKLDLSEQGLIKHAAGELIEAAYALGFEEAVSSSPPYFETYYPKILGELTDAVATILIAMHNLICKDSSHAPCEKAWEENYLRACLEKNRDRAEKKGDKL